MEMKNKTNLLPVWRHVHALRKRTEDITPEELPKDLRLAFLDGDHSYAAAKRDFSLVAPLIAPDGVIALHDTLAFQGVSRVLGEALATGEWRLGGCCGNLSWIRKTSFTQ